jgi:alpha/beta superfamily hydrolase
MRRPEIEGFISIAPQPNTYDFSFLAPCPSSGLIIHGDADKVAPPKDVQVLVDKLHTQKGITITQKTMPGANHFFANDADKLILECEDYLDRRLRGELADPKPKRLR